MTCATRSTRERTMRQGHYPLPPAHVRAHAQLLLHMHVRLADHGPKCTAGRLWAVLLWAASRISSLAAACAALREAPPTRPATTPCWPPSPPWPSSSAAPTAPCNGTRPAACA